MAGSNTTAKSALGVTTSSDRELMLTRVYHAPRELVFECWTEPQHLQHWQGAPRGFTVTAYESDIRPGGFFRICMRSPEGVDHWIDGLYREIVKPERLVFTHAWLEADGQPGPATMITITFTERDGATELTLHQTGFASTHARDGHKVGWTSAFDVLADYLAEERGRREVVVTRVFDAPRDVVFRAWTDADRLKHWWGPRNFTNPVCELDVRPGGAIRIHMRAPGGTVYPMTGTYRQIVEPKRLAYTSAALDEKGNGLFEVLNTVTFDEEDGKTRLTVRASATKVTAEGAPYLVGMQEGWSQSLERLEGGLAAEAKIGITL